MASQYVISTGSIPLVAATAKVCIEIPTGATKDFEVIGLEFSFDYSLATLHTCVVEWMTYATTGTGTTVTATKYGKNQGPSAILGTVKINHTAAPGTLSNAGLPNWVFSLPGMYSINYPYVRELYQPVSTLRCLRLTSSVATNVCVVLTIEQ